MAARLLLAISVACTCLAVIHADGDGFLVGVGKADITGPVADVNLMGYANPDQFAAGIHTRLYARAFIAADSADPSRRFAFVNMDAGMASQAVTFTVIAKLKELYGKELYSEQNVALSGTHTHAGPAGYLQYVIYGITSLGFYTPTFDAIVAGVVLSIQRAHDDLQPGGLSVGSGELLGANINRSPTAYLENPAWERQLYGGDIDKQMTLLRVDDAQGRALGAFSWFPVHGTSMNNTNSLVSGDNKGSAAQFMEHWAAARPVGGAQQAQQAQQAQHKAPADVSDGLVAAFCQANVGDTSPNTQGAFCMDTGEPCDAVHSTCGGRVQQCIGRGPGWPDHFASTRIVGQKQADKAQALLTGDLEALSGAIEYRHTFLDMRNIQVEASNFTRAGTTCKPAMGFAFAAGTTDGPGAFDFQQSDTNGTAFWRLVRNFIRRPTPEQEACHKPKPILLDVGEMHYPYEWVPYITEIQILRAGRLLILCVPGEFTTMAGRRLKRAVQATVEEAWGSDLHIVIAGLTNTYASYITTAEEYGAQRYEGGFTLYGQHTLDAYIQEFVRLATAMTAGKATPAGPPPPNQLSKQWSLVPPVVADGVPAGKAFGDVAEDVPPGSFAVGDTVVAVFHAGCPRNNIRAEGTFLAVERRADNGSWLQVHSDADWSTKFAWWRPHKLSELSYATMSWEVPPGTLPGTYRLRCFGDYKPWFSSPKPYEGSSREFEVEAAPGSSTSSTSGENIADSSSSGGLWGELKDRLLSLGHRAGLGWLCAFFEDSAA